MCVCVCVCVCVFIKLYISRAIRRCHPSHSMPLALIFPRGLYVCVREWSSSVGNVVRLVVLAFVIHALEQNGAFAEIIAPRRPAAGRVPLPHPCSRARARGSTAAKKLVTKACGPTGRVDPAWMWENEQADMGRDSGTCLARLSSRARTGTEKEKYSPSSDDHEQDYQLAIPG